MIDVWLARLREPRFGVVFVTAVIAFLMSAHWAPMALPSALLVGLAVLRPQDAMRPVVWWVMAALWFAAIVLVQERMEDHVPMFAVWLVALAIALGRGDETFIDEASWHARVLIGVAFTAAVSWKLYFGHYVTGATLWLFILVDGRFQPLATAVGLSETAIEQQRLGLTAVLAGDVDMVALDASPSVMWRITAAAVLTLVLEGIIAASHLAPDSNKLASLRLPSVVLFGVVTYGVVPVVPFAALLGMLAMTVARWRREVLWIFPVMVLVGVTRFLVLLT